MQQLQALYPFDYRGSEVAVGGIITVETPEEEQYAELLKQRGMVGSYYGNAPPGETLPAPPGEEGPEHHSTGTQPLSTRDTAMTNVGRRRVT